MDSRATGAGSRSTDTRSFSVALLGGLRLAGRMRLGERLVRVSVIGGMDLDLAEAEFAPAGRLTIIKVSLIGGLEMRIPPGARMRRAYLVAIGGRNIEGGSGGEGTGSPEITVYAFGLLGGLKVHRAPGR